MMKKPDTFDPAKDPNYAPWMSRWAAKRKNTVIKDYLNSGYTRAKAEAIWKQNNEPSVWKIMLNGNFTGYEDFIERRGQPREANVNLNQMLSGMHQLTYDDILDLWQKAKTLPEPERQKAIRYITHLSTRLESKPSQMLVNILLESAF